MTQVKWYLLKLNMPVVNFCVHVYVYVHICLIPISFCSSQSVSVTSYVLLICLSLSADVSPYKFLSSLPQQFLNLCFPLRIFFILMLQPAIFLILSLLVPAKFVSLFPYLSSDEFLFPSIFNPPNFSPCLPSAKFFSLSHSATC